jgi:carbonic anhydrase/acetyltransferase-like protein (isoleucine patch superfamily)
MRYALDGVAPETDGDDWWVAPSAVVIGKIKLERNASVWWNAVIRGDNELITIGENSNVQDGCVLHTDPGFPLTIGKDVTIGHLVMLHGCTIGDGSLVGIGSVILNNTRIGRGCLIAAKTMLGEGKEIPDNSLVMGSPGKVVRQITPEQAARMAAGAQHYVDNWRRYKKGLIPRD